MRLAHTVNPSQTVKVCYRGRMNIYIDIDGPPHPQRAAHGALFRVPALGRGIS